MGEVGLVDVNNVPWTTNGTGMEYHVLAHHLPHPIVVGEHGFFACSATHLCSLEGGDLFAANEIVEYLQTLVQLLRLMCPERPLSYRPLAPANTASPDVLVAAVGVRDVRAPYLQQKRSYEYMSR